jgi:hypothetical protein
LTSLLVWLIDSQTKRFIYDFLQAALSFDIPRLKQTLKPAAKELNDFSDSFVATKLEQRDLKSVVDWACF